MTRIDLDEQARAEAVARMRAMVAEGEIDFSVIEKTPDGRPACYEADGR